MTATVVRPDVARFVQDVRAALADLPVDEVDDLTEGLTADVTDALGDGDVATLGDPADYAAELRSAAGLPPRAATRDDGPAVDFRRPLREAGEWLDGQTWWPAVRDFLVVVRPAWWVLRAWIAYQLLHSVVGGDGGWLPGNPVALLVLVAFVVVSVELGRRSDALARPLRGVVVALNAFAVLLVLVGGIGGGARFEPVGQASAVTPGPGLWSNGEPVRDVFAYDGEGRLVPVVQLYDQDGRPLELADDARSTVEADGSSQEAAPTLNADGRQLWNVFPVRRVTAPPEQYGDDGRPLPAPSPVPSVDGPPFRSVAPVVVPSPGSSPSPTPSDGAASPSPSASPSGGPSPSASPRPSVSPSGTPGPSTR